MPKDFQFRTLTKSAPQYGDICFRLLHTNELIYSHSFFFLPSPSLDKFSTPSSEKITTPRGSILVVRTVTQESEHVLREALKDENVAKAVEAQFRFLENGEKVLATNGNVGDFEIVLEDGRGVVMGRWRAHRVVLAARIPYFMGQFSSGFADANADIATFDTETAAPTLGAVETMRRWCYLAPTEPSPSLESTETSSAAATLIQTAVFAQFLSATDLRDWCLKSASREDHKVECTCPACCAHTPTVLKTLDAYRDEL